MLKLVTEILKFQVFFKKFLVKCQVKQQLNGSGNIQICIVFVYSLYSLRLENFSCFFLCVNFSDSFKAAT